MSNEHNQQTHILAAEAEAAGFILIHTESQKQRTAQFINPYYIRAVAAHGNGAMVWMLPVVSDNPQQLTGYRVTEPPTEILARIARAKGGKR